MIVKTCDICQKKVDDIRELTDEYKVDKVAHVCKDCLKEIDDVLIKIINAQSIQRTSFLRRFIKGKILKH